MMNDKHSDYYKKMMYVLERQIREAKEKTNAKSLIPIHTVNDEYHKKWHKNVKTVNQHGTHQL